MEGVLASINAELGYEIINLGNSKPVTLNEFIKTLEEVTGKSATLEEMGEQPGDVKITYADISKAKKLLNWEPKIKIREGLERFVDWYKKNRLLD